MKKIFKSILLLMLLPLVFTSCSTKNEEYLSDSKTQDISKLLNMMIQKEKEINELKKQLEDCKNQK